MKLPPYGAKLEAFLASGQKPKNDIFCFCGREAWQRATSSSKCQLTLCLPFKANPFEFRWPVKGCPILLYETGSLQAKEIERFIYCLFTYGASIIRLVPYDFKYLFVYRREAKK